MATPLIAKQVVTRSPLAFSSIFGSNTTKAIIIPSILAFSRIFRSAGKQLNTTKVSIPHNTRSFSTAPKAKPSILASSRIFVSVEKQLNDTKAVIADSTRFFTTAPKPKPSILAFSRIFGSAGKQLNTTKAIIPHNIRFFSTASKAKPSILAYSRIFGSAGKQLNTTKAIIPHNTRSFSTAPKAQPSILKEFLDWLRKKQSSKKREIKVEMTSGGLEISVDVSGFCKDDMKVEIEGGKLRINGVVEDGMGKAIEIKETIPIFDFPFKFDPENVWAETCNGQLKVSFPFSENKEDKYKKGRFRVKWAVPQWN